MRWKVARMLKFFLDLLTVSVSWFLTGVSSFFAAYLRRIYDRKSSLCSLNLGPVKSRRLAAAAVRLLSHIADIQWHMQGWHCCSLNYISVWTQEEESLVSLLLIKNIFLSSSDLDEAAQTTLHLSLCQKSLSSPPQRGFYPALRALF